MEDSRDSSRAPALDELFRSRSHVRVLRALLELPEGLGTSARDLARRSGVSHPMASRVLASLTAQGIVRVTRLPRADLFELNRRHTAVAPLRDLFDWERRLDSERTAFLGKIIRSRVPAVRAAFLFGSVARGEEGPPGDLDVAVVCAPSAADEVRDAMDRVADVVRERFGMRLGVVVGTESIDRLRRPGRPGRALWERIAAEGIPLVTPPRRRRAGG